MTVSDVTGKFRDAFYTALPYAVKDDVVQFTRGLPGPKQADDIVGLMDVETTQDFATMSTNRTRELVITATVTVSVWRKGGPDQQAIAEARALDLMNRIEEYVRVTDTTLGGVVRHCFCTGTRMTVANPDTVAKGREVQVDGTFVAPARITN